MKSLKNLLLSTFIFTFIFIFTFTFISCEEPTSSNSESNNASVTLSVADVSCTEAWLRVTAEGVNFNNGAEFTLLRDDTVRSSFPIYSADTVIYDEGLLPSKTYRYTAKLTFTPTQTNGSVTKESNTTEAVTMDTTSHEFTWETYTFGGANGSSYLMDVAIINENDIWAVGEIHTEDTDQWNEDSTEWIQPYNAAHWNGQEWELKRIKWVDGWTYEKRAIFVFNNNDILFGSNILYDGSSYKYLPPLPVDNNGNGWRINSMWGVSSDDFYVVGNGGNIAHYKNGSWKKVESGTELDFYDIWGDYNEIDKEYEIIAIASKLFESYDRDIIKITQNGAKKVTENGIVWPLHGIWFNSPYKYYAVGSGIYQRETLTSGKNWNKLAGMPNIFMEKVRGISYNDVFIIGDFGEVLHYNGVRWHDYIGELPYINGVIYGAAITEKTICLVGNNERQAIVYLSNR